MVLLDRNWRCPAGEIDLVLRDGDDLVVCEVKTRSGLSFGTPHEAVDATKLARLQELAVRWLAEHEIPHPPGIRIDLVAVLRPRQGPLGRRSRARGALMPSPPPTRCPSTAPSAT